jgi:hypothetical protein
MEAGSVEQAARAVEARARPQKSEEVRRRKDALVAVGRHDVRVERRCFTQHGGQVLTGRAQHAAQGLGRYAVEAGRELGAHTL